MTNKQAIWFNKTGSGVSLDLQKYRLKIKNGQAPIKIKHNKRTKIKQATRKCMARLCQKIQVNITYHV